MGKLQREALDASIICLTFHTCSWPEVENSLVSVCRSCLRKLTLQDLSTEVSAEFWRGPRRIEHADVYFDATSCLRSHDSSSGVASCSRVVLVT